MKRRDVLRAAVALPVAAALPAVVLPTTTYTYKATMPLPDMNWVTIKDGRKVIWEGPLDSKGDIAAAWENRSHNLEGFSIHTRHKNENTFVMY